LLLSRYAWANDTNDNEGIKRCFTEHCTLATSDPPGWTPGRTWPGPGRDAVVAFIADSRRLYPTTRRRHFITNVDVVEYRDNFARVRSYFSVMHTPANGQPRVTHNGWYDDTMEKQPDGRWLIAARTQHKDNAPPPEEGHAR
jgi:hypothetical protein